MRRSAERSTYTYSFVLNFGSDVCVNLQQQQTKLEKMQDFTQNLTSESK